MAATEIVPGVHRLGSERVNFYLVEEGGRVTVTDAGVSGYWDQVEPGLRAIGRGLDDVAAVVLTHAHSDHTGVAGELHERGVPIYLHPADHELMRTGKESWKREGSALSILAHPRVYGFFFHMARNGATKPPHIEDPVAAADGDVLDVPGRPRVIHTPGHTPGHCAILFEEHGALVVGDLLCTWHPVLGREGPQIMPAAFNMSSAQCLESLGRLEGLPAETVLTGHGEPWREGAAAAVAEGRRVGPS
jgi:glyoxylase-like metal-dependent hydrolase (beta-lactamase superfamily II)